MAVPDSVVELACNLDERMQRLELHMGSILQSWSPEVLACLSPTERASAYMAVSRALNAVYCAFLKTRGESPDNHPVKSELDRASLYQEKVQFACNKIKAPRPTISLNLPAATRFIEHSIPDLTEEQKQLVREAGTKRSNTAVGGSSKKKKKKQKSAESVAQAAAAFLAEASKELPPSSNPQ